MIKKISLLVIFNISLIFAQGKNIVFYGTSLTVVGKWVRNLMYQVNKDFPNVTYYNSAKGGMNSIWGKTNLKNLVINKRPDIVFMEFAINDCYELPNPYYNYTIVPLDLSRQNAEDMVDSLRKYNSKVKIFILGMSPPLDSLIDGRNPAVARPHWKTYFQAWQDVAQEKNITYIDITKKWLGLDRQTLWNYLPDGLHESELGGIRIIIPTILPVLEAYLRTVTVSDNSTLSLTFELKQNFPNPFNPTTNISFSIPQSGLVTLKIYNILGQEVATLLNSNIPAGVHEIRFNARNLAGGVYIYHIQTQNFVDSKKFILLK